MYLQPYSTDKNIDLILYRRVRTCFYLKNRYLGKNIYHDNTDIPIVVPPVGIKAFPASTVVSEQEFGQAANPGHSQDYSRGDHTHGTPEIQVDGATIGGTGRIGDPLFSRGGRGIVKTIIAGANIIVDSSNPEFPIVSGNGGATKDFDFIFTDWTGPSIGFYSIIFAHNLGTTLVEVEVFDASNQPIDIEREILDVNRVSLRVPADPDLRLAGNIWIKTT